MKIGIIGAGHIGGTLARKLHDLGHDVEVANSRGPETLGAVASATGAKPATIDEAAHNKDVVIVTIPEKSVTDLPKGLFAHGCDDTVVVDTGNYYPQRDGRIAEIEAGEPESKWVADHLGRRVVKAFNSIRFDQLRDRGRPKGDPQRIALPVAGDSHHDKEVVIKLVNEMGFDAVDAGTLDDSWRQQPGSPVYLADLDVQGTRRALGRSEPRAPSGIQGEALTSIGFQPRSRRRHSVFPDDLGATHAGGDWSVTLVEIEMLRLTKPTAAGIAVVAVLAACKSRTEQTAGGTVETAMGRVGTMAETAMAKMTPTTTWSNPVIIGYAATANNDEIKLGKLAVKKSTNGDVKAFARMMVTDHEKMLADTRKLGTRLKVSADTTASDVQQLSTGATDAMKELTDKPAGADWDKNYMDKMVAGHEAVLQKLRDAAKTTDTEVRTALEGAITKVEAHLTKAKEVRAKLDTAT